MKNSNDCKNCIHAVLFLATCKEVCGDDDSTKTELIEGCEFCRGEDVVYFNDYSIQINNHRLVTKCDEAYHGSELSINYCPMCGKELVEV